MPSRPMLYLSEVLELKFSLPCEIKDTVSSDLNPTFMFSTFSYLLTTNFSILHKTYRIHITNIASF